jgi:hypothetical protein
MCVCVLPEIITIDPKCIRLALTEKKRTQNGLSQM